jgi:hypothetical protein
VPKTLSRSCDQAIFVDQATGASVFLDAVLLKIDRFGQRLQRRGAVQGAVRPVLVVVALVLAQDPVRAENLVRGSGQQGCSSVLRP